MWQRTPSVQSADAATEIVADTGAGVTRARAQKSRRARMRYMLNR